MKSDGLYQVPRSRGGGKVLVVDGKPQYYPPLKQPIVSRRGASPEMALDALPVWALDEEPAPESDFSEDEAELARYLAGYLNHDADAVCDALRSYRKAKDERSAGRLIGETPARSADRAGNMTTQNDRRGRDALPNPNDHRADFRSGDSVSRDELNAALKAAFSGTRGLATDSSRGSDTRITGIDRAELLGLN